MTITRRIVENGVIYCKCNGVWIVGDNKTTAFASNHVRSNILFIPRAVRGHQIKEIGVMAFREEKQLVSVFIDAQVTQINHHAFSRCSYISFINVPPSVEFIGEYAFHFGIDNDIVSNSSVSVLFENSSKNLYIEASFRYIETISIFYCRTVPAVYGSNILDRVTNVNVYSPNDMIIFGYKPRIDSTKCHEKLIANIKSLYCSANNKQRVASRVYLLVAVILLC